MHNDGIFFTDQKIHEYDGYQSEPIWKIDEKESTYYDYLTDKQCRIPMPSIEELKRELEIAKSRSTISAKK